MPSPVRRLGEQVVVEEEGHDVEHEEERQHASEREVPVPKQTEVEQRPMMARLRDEQRREGDRCQHKRNDYARRRGTGGGQHVQPVDEHQHEEGEQAEPEPVHLARLAVLGAGMRTRGMATTFNQKFTRHPA